MSREKQKARKRANRRLKRQAEHKQRMIEKHEAIMQENANKNIDKDRVKIINDVHGRKDPTAYFAIKYMYSRAPEIDRIYI